VKSLLRQEAELEKVDEKLEFNIEEYDLSDRPRRFLEAFAAILQHTNYGVVLEQYARTMAKCSLCSLTCPVYERTDNPADMPCYRAELLIRIYRRYFTPGGIIRARLFGGYTLTDEDIDEMAEYYWRCTACRRCKLSCPMGLDVGLITHLARWILAEIGIAPRALVVSVREQLEGETRNTSAFPFPAIKDSCEFLEEELRDEYGIVAKFPFDVEDVEYLFVPPVSDFMMEAETLMGNAAVMTATGVSWTLGSKYYDAINYGLFYSDRMLERIIKQLVEEAKRLRARKILVGECGHASRAAKVYVPVYGGDDAPEVVNCIEYAYQMMLDGKLKLRPNAIKERVTYHDPCNISRSGWIVEQPRELLKAICADYVDMEPNGVDNYCCGGGGGTVSIDEIRKWRTSIGGAKKAEQIRETGAKYIVSPSADCKKQLREQCQDNGLDDVEVVGLHDLLIKAIEFPDFMKAPVKSEDTEE